MPKPIILYKGAAPGTWWHHNDAKVHGFTGLSGTIVASSVQRHIVNYSYPSPYTSFSLSFAIARGYALVGKTDLATPTNPGYVYEIDLTGVPGIVDPLAELTGAAGIGDFLHTHDGSSTLIAEVAENRPLTMAPKCGVNVPLCTPSVSDGLRALLFAIRDAEVLVAGDLPPSVVIHKHAVSP